MNEVHTGLKLLVHPHTHISVVCYLSIRNGHGELGQVPLGHFEWTSSPWPGANVPHLHSVVQAQVAAEGGQVFWREGGDIA